MASQSAWLCAASARASTGPALVPLCAVSTTLSAPEDLGDLGFGATFVVPQHDGCPLADRQGEQGVVELAVRVLGDWLGVHPVPTTTSLPPPVRSAPVHDARAEVRAGLTHPLPGPVHLDERVLDG